MIRLSIILMLTVCVSMTTNIFTANGQESIFPGDNAAIRGEIVDVTPEQNPIEGATVTIVNSSGKIYKVTTDEMGAYEQKGLPAGRYSISVDKKGYGPRVGKSKVVAAGGEAFDRIKMRKKDTIYTFYLSRFFSIELIVGLIIGFAGGFLAALILNALQSRVRH